MTLHLEKQTTRGGGWTAIDIQAEKISDFKLSRSYSHPDMLTFIVHQAHHTVPIEKLAGIRFWDDAGEYPTSTAFSSSNPTFLGYVEDVDPGDDGLTVRYTCLDPTVRSSAETPIMSAAWTDATTEGTGTVPRLVFNASINNDDDWAFTRFFDQTIGQIISYILDDPLARLRTMNAAPAADVAYVTADLAAMDFQPQEKITFHSEPIRNGIVRIIEDWEPEYRLLFDPDDQQWRFFDLGAGTQVTRTLNDFTEDNPILSIEIERSIEGRYTAVKYYGPEQVETRVVSVSDGELTDISDGPVLDTYAAGAIVRGKNKWQITDTDKRRVGRRLPTAYLSAGQEIQIASNVWLQFQSLVWGPQLQAKFSDRTSTVGTDNWQTIVGWWLDSVNGIISFDNTYVYRYDPDPPIIDSILQPNYENPSDVRFIYPNYVSPLSVRYPTSSYSGTAYDDYGLQAELKIYDEMLAVGYLYGTPVTTATRVAKFLTLATKMHTALSDVLHMGGATFEGFDYEWFGLNRRANFDGVDGDGGALATGWESIDAIVTDVEYDYEELTTTIMFSTDQQELLGRDPETLKARLKLRSQIISFLANYSVTYRYYRKYTQLGTPYLGQDISVTASITPVAFDPYYGTVERLL